MWKKEWTDYIIISFYIYLIAFIITLKLSVNVAGQL